MNNSPGSFKTCWTEQPPLKEIKTRVKPHKLYYNKYIRKQRRTVKTRKRTWLKYRQQHQWHTYKMERNIYNRLLKYHKKQCITHQVHKNNKNTKGLFKLVNKLTNSKKENPLPNKLPEQLADEFASYFLSKIEDIQQRFQGIPEFDPPHRDIPKFKKFSLLTTKQVRKAMMQMKNKSCELDVIPTDELKVIQDACINSITKIVNMSLTNGEFCNQWKTANIRPLIKKLGLELINKNYRQVSNFCFLSKLVDKCMLDQLMDHCNSNDLLPDFQSAYHQNYSTETSLINITNDILWSMEN